MISLKFKLQMCFTFIFTCIMAMVYNFSKIFIISKLLHKCNIVLHLDVILVLLLLILTFSSFQNQLFFSGFPFKIHKTFSYNLFHDMFVFYVIKCPNLWRWTITGNMLTYFCCWRIFLIICTSIFWAKDSISA